MAGVNVSSDEECEGREEYRCPVCWDFLCEPFSFKSCGHKLCKKCLLNLKKFRASMTCPLCRGNVDEGAIPAKDAELKMAKIKEKCPGCQEEFSLGVMRAHMMNCNILSNLDKSYHEAERKAWNSSGARPKVMPPISLLKPMTFCNGPTADVVVSKKDQPRQNYTRESRPLSFLRNQMPSGHNSNYLRFTTENKANTSAEDTESGDSNSNEMGADIFESRCEGTSPKAYFRPRKSCNSETDDSPSEDDGATNRQDGRNFRCPFCQQDDLNQSQLRKHCLKYHGAEKTPVVCPICSSMPWGDPKQTSADFIKHLGLRHRFKYKEYMTEGENEEEMLCHAIQNSLNHF